MELIESDFSVFHRVDDILTLEAHTFYSRAKLLGTYTGAVQNFLTNEEEKKREHEKKYGVTVEPDALLAKMGFENK